MSKAPRKPPTPQHGPGTKPAEAESADPVTLEGFLYTKIKGGWVLLEVTLEDGVIVEKFPCSKDPEPKADMFRRLVKKAYEVMMMGGKKAQA